MYEQEFLPEYRRNRMFNPPPRTQDNGLEPLPYYNNSDNPWDNLSLMNPAPEQISETPIQDTYGPSTTKYQEMLSQGAPKREDYKRSTVAKIGSALSAGLMGFAGDSNAAQKATANLDAPYERALQAYSTQLGPLGEASRLELNQYNSRIQAEKASREYLLATQKNTRDNALAGSRLQLDAARVGDIRSQTENRGQENIFDQNGNYLRVGPDGSVRNLGNFRRSDAENDAAKAAMAQYESGLTLSRQRTMAGVNFGYNSALKQTPGAWEPSRIPTSDINTATNLAEYELSNDPMFASIYTRDEKTGQMLRNQAPVPYKGNYLYDSNDAQVKGYNDLVTEYERRKQELIRKYTNTESLVGRFTIR